MAAQARHYEKSITYSPRQVDEKYISKNHSHMKSSSGESSPYRGSSKTTSSSYSSSPGRRKRPYNSSPSSSSSSKVSNSPYESIRKKDRIDNEMGKNDCENSNDSRLDDDETGMKRSHCHRCPVNGYIKDDNEWSQHVSSSGKIYYYNRHTEESQWEVPKGWNERSQESKEPSQKGPSARESLNFSKESGDREDYRDVRDPRDHRYKDKMNSKDYRHQDSRSYRDSRKIREKDSREQWDNKEREYRDRDTREIDAKHRVTPVSSKRGEVKYNSPGIRTVGQSTPSSSTSHSRSYRRPTPDSLNGSESVQDISPPGTPTNDDLANISTISPSPLYTPHSTCSPLSTTLTASRHPLPTTPHTPLLSPILINSTSHIPTPYLHPLQQALLLQQQQATTNKDVYGSPKLPTVKNHVHPGVVPPASPMTSNQKTVPMTQSPEVTNRTETPPPPPPPLKDHNRMSTDMKNRNNTSKSERQTVQTPTDSYTEHPENYNRSKTHEYQPGDTPVKAPYRTFNPDRYLKKTVKLDKEETVTFSPLPDLNKYNEYFSPSVADLTTTFYCNTLENQINIAWEETMNLLHSEGYRSKFNLSISRQMVDSQDSKLDVSSRWVDALNSVISKVESLQDSSMKSEARMTTRETKSPITRKNNRPESNNSEYSSSQNGEKSDIRDNNRSTPVRTKDPTPDTFKNLIDSVPTPNTVTQPVLVHEQIDHRPHNTNEMCEKNSSR